MSSTQRRIKTLEQAGQTLARIKGPRGSDADYYRLERKRGVKRNARRGQEAEPTFCGDLDVETGDCGLMFLAEEPADKDETGIKKKGGGVC